MWSLFLLLRSHNVLGIRIPRTQTKEKTHMIVRHELVVLVKAHHPPSHPGFSDC
jgi:hypothetical protein